MSRFGFAGGPTGRPALPLTGGTLVATSAGAQLLNFSDPGISGASITSSFAGGSFSQAEYIFQNNIAGQNVLSVQNNSTGGFSAYTVRATDRAAHLKERLAIGYALSGSGYVAANQSYVEFSGYPQSAIASYTASVASGVMTTTGTSGTINVGDVVFGSTLSTQVPTIITSQTGGTPGGDGTYAVSGTVNAGSASMSSGTAAAFKLIHTGFIRGANLTWTRMTFTEDGHIWFNTKYNGTNTGVITAAFEPVNGYFALNGSQDAVVPLDVNGNALFGNGGNTNRASGATFPVTIDDTSGNVLRGIKDLVVKFDVLISGSGSTRQGFIKDTDNGGGTVLAWSLNGTNTVTVGSILKVGSSAGQLTIPSPPTSSAGLPSGTIYSNSGVATFVP